MSQVETRATRAAYEYETVPNYLVIRQRQFTIRLPRKNEPPKDILDEVGLLGLGLTICRRELLQLLLALRYPLPHERHERSVRLVDLLELLAAEPICPAGGVQPLHDVGGHVEDHRLRGEPPVVGAGRVDPGHREPEADDGDEEQGKLDQKREKMVD